MFFTVWKETQRDVACRGGARHSGGLQDGGNLVLGEAGDYGRDHHPDGHSGVGQRAHRTQATLGAGGGGDDDDDVLRESMGD